MRIRFFLVCASASFVAAGFGIQACGGTSTEDTTTDAGNTDASEASAPPKADAAPEAAADARPPCDPNKDVLKDIPDASIPDSSSTTGLCLACAKTNCKDEIDNCQKDCSRSATDLGCQDLASKALQCYTQKQDFIACGGDFFSAKAPTQGIGAALGICVSESCQSECGVPTDGGADSGR